MRKPTLLAASASILCAATSSINASLLTSHTGLSDFTRGLSVGIPLGLSVVLLGITLHLIRQEQQPL